MSHRDPRAGQPAQAADLIDVGALLAAYADLRPDPSMPAQRVAFGTSGHRGSALDSSFNEWHVLAISQAICEYRAAQSVDGPVFVGCDTHALSRPAFESALEVLAANGVQVRISAGGEFTPTPAVSHAILVHNRGRSAGLADGIVITPSHNPPRDGGFKYNPANGGPAESDATGWIQERANALIVGGLREVRRIPLARARVADGVREHDYLRAYVADLASVVDFDAIRGSHLRLGVDPLGGAGVHYWAPIAEAYGLDLSVVSDAVDPTFSFMTLDWDGRIRMDPSSADAMQRLVGLKDRFDVAFACDTDHDRHGVVTRSTGLLAPNAYLAVLADYLGRHRPDWPARAAIGKTVVTTALLDRVAKRLGRKLFEAPVGFKWFAPGLFDASLAFGCEESAGASLLRRDGKVWTTDKDGIVPALLSAEITARTGRDPGEAYRALVGELGEPFSDRVEAPATPAQKQKLAQLRPEQVQGKMLAGEAITQVLVRAPGNDAPIGGIKLVSASGWAAARPSGTEAIYKIYAESFRDPQHLHELLAQAQAIVDRALQ
ncbi:MAG: phosphoglucomutase (alpha-D-glucose-1,6-bisphosphate-dependent) [Arenimonas sp.]